MSGALVSVGQHLVHPWAFYTYDRLPNLYFSVVLCFCPKRACNDAYSILGMQNVWDSYVVATQTSMVKRILACSSILIF